MTEISALLIDRVLDRTQERPMNWRPTFNREEYVISFARSSVSIAARPDRTKVLKVYNGKGLMFDEIVVGQQAEELWQRVDRLFTKAAGDAYRGREDSQGVAGRTYLNKDNSE